METNRQLIIDRFEAIPFQKYLGLKLESFDEDEVVASLNSKPELVGNEVEKILHGGVIASAIDAVGGYVAGRAARAWLEQNNEDPEQVMRLATIDMRVDYLSPGRGERFMVHGKIQKAGRRFISVRVDMTNDKNALVATGTANFLY